MEPYDIFLGICFLIGGLFLLIADKLGTLDWSSFIGGVLITITAINVTSRAWTGWKSYKALYES